MSQVKQGVRVTRTGNTRAFPIPAGVAREVGLEVGDHYVLEVIGESVMYRRAVSQAEVVQTGSGQSRTFQPLRDRAVFEQSAEEGSALLNDWDF